MPGNCVAVGRPEEECSEDQQVERPLQEIYAGTVAGVHCVDSLRYIV
jgi:hypothetical protein